MNWLYTRTGKKLIVENFSKHDVCIEDIAHHLAINNRWSGATKTPYSVAQHSVYVSHKVTDNVALQALLHDAPEAYLCDLPRPVKKNCFDYRILEHHFWKAICEKFSLQITIDDQVVEADHKAMRTEAKDLMHSIALTEDLKDIKPYDDVITPLSWEDARQCFADRFVEISGLPFNWELYS